MSPKSPKLCEGIGDVALVILKFVHHSNPIYDKYPNRTNNRKLQRVVLVEVDAKVVRRGSNAILFFVFTNANFPEQKFYATKQYIHVTKEGTQESLFVLEESVVPAAGAGGIGALAIGGNNHTDGVEANDAANLLSVCTLNLRSEDMAEIRRKGITTYDDNDPEPENVPSQGGTTAGTGNCRIEGIICPRKACNIQNSFASFRHYSYDAILCISLLQFLIMFPEDYLEKFLITDTNKGVSVPMELQEFIKWVGCWL